MGERGVSLCFMHSEWRTETGLPPSLPPARQCSETVRVVVVVMVVVVVVVAAAAVLSVCDQFRSADNFETRLEIYDEIRIVDKRFID